MKTIIIGAGFTGVQLARALLAEDHHVTLIDPNPERVRDVGSRLDCAVVQAEGNSLEVLEKAGLAEADTLVALATQDEVNMVASALADARYPKVLKIARVRNYAYYQGKVSAHGRLFGIDWMLNPDVEAARAIERALDHGAVGEVLELEGGYGITDLVLGERSPLNGMALKFLPSLPMWHYLVAYVQSAGEMFLPNGDTVLHAGDHVGILSSIYDIAQVVRACDAGAGVLGRVAIVGASAIGNLVLAQELEKARRDQELLLVDEDLARCRQAAERFRNVRVLCGDVTDEELIREEHLEKLDVVVAASENHERNLITAACMKARGVGRTVVLAASSAQDALATKLGVDVVVPLRDTIVDSIMSHLRGRDVTSVHTLGDNLEIVTRQVEESAEENGKQLRNLKLGGRALALIVHRRNGSCLLPNGNTVIHSGDRITWISRR